MFGLETVLIILLESSASIAVSVSKSNKVITACFPSSLTFCDVSNEISLFALASIFILFCWCTRTHISSMLLSKAAALSPICKIPLIPCLSKERFSSLLSVWEFFSRTYIGRFGRFSRRYQRISLPVDSISSWFNNSESPRSPNDKSTMAKLSSLLCTMLFALSVSSAPKK